MASKKRARPPQHQKRQPGRQTRMNPRPAAEAADYVGSFKLVGRVALVTGGDSGIGRAVAIAFAKEGADIAFAYLEEDRDAEKTVRLVEAERRRCLAFKGDVADPKFCARIVADTVRRLERLDILVNNAGEQHVKDGLEEISADQLVRTFSTNVFSMFYLTSQALAHFARGAVIVNSASVTAYRGSDHLIDYSASKGAIVSFTRSLSKQLAERGIRVNAVAPGPVWTPLIPATFPADAVAEFGTQVPLGRAAEPDEIAPCYVFLASDDSSYMTGQVLHPNGGEMVGG
jgi:NAD(P)-dependent dehydrogenase (short-subunit alcohol dehydrogenase family)